MKRSAVTLMMTLALSGSVYAQTSGGGSPEMQAAREALVKACQADSKSLCADKEGRELMMCLRSNADKLSAGCKDALSKIPARRTPPPQ